MKNKTFKIICNTEEELLDAQTFMFANDIEWCHMCDTEPLNTTELLQSSWDEEYDTCDPKELLPVILYHVDGESDFWCSDAITKYKDTYEDRVKQYEYEDYETIEISERKDLKWKEQK